MKEIPGINLNDTIGQPIFTPCSQGIVYTAWLGSNQKLGMIYCYQRPCEIRLVRFIESLFSSSNQDLGNYQDIKLLYNTFIFI